MRRADKATCQQRELPGLMILLPCNPFMFSCVSIGMENILVWGQMKR